VSKKLTIAVVGLGFGGEFIPLYANHPDVSQVVICDTDPEVTGQMAGRFNVQEQRRDLDAVLADDQIDAVHLATPIPIHAEQSQSTLQAGKHCACAVPMALNLADIEAVIKAQRTSGKTYMMMETAVRTREFLWAQEQVAQGRLGRIQFLRGTHYQAMESWGRHPGSLPRYWWGLPPMFYGTHAIAPVLALANTRASHVHCFGSGRMRPELEEHYGNPFPVETAIFRLEGTDVAAEVTKSLFQTARAVTESFSVYGEHASFEWQQLEDDPSIVFRMTELPRGADKSARSTELQGMQVTSERFTAPDRPDLLPAEISRFTQPTAEDRAGHRGSHPHLVHEFVRAIVEDRPPAIDAITAANWTGAGIAAHESAMQDGAGVDVPDFNAL
jgi:predicted dehydrogenase